MRRLNKSRVALKHHGTLPSKLDLEAFRSATATFFEENTPTIFGAAFSSLSLTSFVVPEEARNHLEAAQAHLERGVFSEAAEEAAVAFGVMLDSFEESKRGRSGRLPFSLSEDMAFLTSYDLGLDRDRLRSERSLADADGQHASLLKIADFVDKTEASLEMMGKALRVMAVGIDYRRYSRFRGLAGEGRTVGQVRYFRRYYGGWAPDEAPTAVEAQFCVDFVIEAAVALQDFDYSLPEAHTKPG